MKKILLIVTSVVLFSGIISCEKDGFYTPKKKICKIYCSYDEVFYDTDTTVATYSSSRFLSEQWEWKGRKLASRTFFYSDGSVAGKYSYTYDGKRLSRIDYISKGESGTYTTYTIFTYDGNELVQADWYFDGHYGSVARFSHTDGKITAVDIFYVYKSNSMGISNDVMLNMLMPPDIQMSYAYRRICAKEGENPNNYRIEISWRENNIHKMCFINNDGVETCEFSYDDKNNPFYGMGVMWIDISAGTYNMVEQPVCSGGYDRNNIVSATITNTLDGRVNASYTYTYKDDYPAICMVKNYYCGSSDVFAPTELTCYYEYEYLK